MSALPRLLIHKQTARYYLNFEGKRHYLGPWEPSHKKPPSQIQIKYNLLIGRILGIQETQPEVRLDSIQVSELCSRFMLHIQTEYPTGTAATSWRCVVRHLVELYGDWPAAAIGPAKLGKLQDHLITKGHTRQGINKICNQVRQVFSWGVRAELLRPEILVGLKTVRAVRRGRAPESRLKEQVPDSTIAKTLPFLSRVLASMVSFQRLTGCRPGEVCRASWGDIRKDEEIWWLCPMAHKTAWRGHRREIPLGPKAQALIRQFESISPEAPLFPTQGQNRAGRFHDLCNYASRIRAACKLAGVEHWSPNQLRKRAAQAALESLGEDHARALLGHQDAEVTRRHYLSRERTKAADAALRIG
jgi:integrase